MAIKNHHIHVKGSKDRFRDFVYIDDVVDAVIKASERKGLYEVYNVCTGVPTTVENVVASIVDDLPYQVTVEYSGGTSGDHFGIYGDCSKKSDLGWDACYIFNVGMKKMIDWA